MEDISKKFTHIYEIVSGPSFLKMDSIGGEIPFYISAYDIKQEEEICKSITSLKNKLELDGLTILEINLYDVVIDVINKNSSMEKFFALEQKKSKEKFKRNIQSALNLEKRLMPHISDMIEKSGADIYFLTGIGPVFPFLRSHTILNNLQSVATKSPTLTFFPGNYNGFSLELFGKFTDDNYYRAINIDCLQK